MVTIALLLLALAVFLVAAWKVSFLKLDLIAVGLALWIASQLVAHFIK